MFPITQLRDTHLRISSTLLSSSRKIINPSPQPVSPLRNLQLEIRLRPRIITPIELHPRLISFKHVLTIQRIRILRPAQRTLTRSPHIHTINPTSFLTRIRPRIDPRNQFIREIRHRSRTIASTSGLLNHLRIPACVQVRRLAIPRNGYVVAAYGFGFVV